jgi:hypothetical protein
MSPVPQRRGVIPAAAMAIAAFLGAIAFFGVTIAFVRDTNTPPLAVVFFPAFFAACFAGYILLIGYIYGDARRRGMRYVAWTFLAALAPSAIGIILYFILRNPMPVHCTKCGSGSQPGFAYCPRCGAPMAATCRQCNRTSEAGWSHCAWCGGKL